MKTTPRFLPLAAALVAFAASPSVHARALGISNRAIDPAQIGNFGAPGTACTDGQFIAWETDLAPDGFQCVTGSGTPSADTVNGTELADTITLDAPLVILADTALETITFQLVDNNAAALTIEGSDGLNLIVGGTLNGAETLVFGHSTVDSHTFTTDGTGTAEVVLPNGAIGLAELDGAACADGETIENISGTSWGCVAAGTPGPDSVDTGTIAADTITLEDVADTLASDNNLDIDFDAGNDTFHIHLDEANAAAFKIENGTAADFLLIDSTADAITLGHGSATFALASSGVDISTAGAVSSVTTLAMTGALSGATDGTFTGTLATALLTTTGTTTIGDGGASDATANILLGTSTDNISIDAEILTTSLVFEGATDSDGFETTIAIGDAAADVTLTVPVVTTGDFALSVAGASPTLANKQVAFSTNPTEGGIVFEGSSGGSGNAFELYLIPGGDISGADVTITLPTATGTLIATGDTGSVTGTMVLDNTLDFADIADAPTLDANTTINPSTFTFAHDVVNNNAQPWVVQNDTGGADYIGIVTTTGAEQVVLGSSEVDAVIVTTDAWTTTDTGTDGDYDSFKLEVDAAAAGVFEIEAGSDDMLLINTDTDALAFGNDTTNPAYTFHGTGTSLFDGAATVTGVTTLNGTATINSTVISVGDAVTDGVTLTAAVQGASIVLDGATDNTNTTTLAIPDVGASQTITIPDSSASDTTTAFVVSTEAANAVQVAASVWVVANGITLEGATGDAHESTIDVTDPTVGDQTFRLPDLAGNTTATFAFRDFGQTWTAAQTFPAVTINGDLNANDVGADTLYLGAAADTVTVLGDISLTDTNWSVSAAGAADFLSLNDTPIGASTASTGAFTTLSATGDVTMNAAGVNNILLGDSGATVTLTGSAISLTDDNYSFTSAGVGSLVSLTLSGAAGLTLSSAETITNGTDGTFTFTRNTAAAVTITAADTDATAALTVLPGGASSLTLGGGSTTALIVTTDSTGNDEVQLPAGSIDSGEILDATIGLADTASASSQWSIPIMYNDDAISVSTGTDLTITLPNSATGWPVGGWFKTSTGNGVSGNIALRSAAAAGGIICMNYGVSGTTGHNTASGTVDASPCSAANAFYLRNDSGSTLVGSISVMFAKQ